MTDTFRMSPIRAHSSRLPRRTVRSSVVVAVMVVAALALGACGSSGSDSDDAGPPGTGNEKPSESNGTSSTTADASATAAFSKGLAVLWSNSNGTTVAVLPSGLDDCVYEKLPAGDITVVSGLQVPADGSDIEDAVGIRVFKASNTCDRAGILKVFSTQLGLDRFGVTPTAAQNECVAGSVLDGVVALDADTATGKSGEALKAPFAAALQACVPIRDFLLAAIANQGLSPDVAACAADKAAETITWLEVINNDPGLEAKGQAAGAACANVTGN